MSPHPEDVAGNLEAARQDLPRIVFEALGEASMCWDPIPAGVFNSSRAKEIGDRVVAEICAMQEAPLQDSEQYRMQIAGICTAAIGYWKEGDSIHPDYDTIALRDVAKLYAKYDALFKAATELLERCDVADGGDGEIRTSTVRRICRQGLGETA